LKVKFLIEEDGFEGKTLTGWASLTFSPKAKLFGWVKAAVFGGREIPAGRLRQATCKVDHLRWKQQRKRRAARNAR